MAYAAALAPDQKSRPDALLVVDVDPGSTTYSQVVGRVDLPHIGDELHRKTGYSRPHTVHCGPEGST